MKNISLRYLALFVSFLLAFSVLGCAYGEAVEPADMAGTTKIHWLNGAYFDEELERVIAEVNRRLALLDEPLEIILSGPRDWSIGYSDYVKEQLTSGDTEYDVIGIASNMGFFKYAQENAFEDIGPLLDTYTYVLDTIKPEIWKLVSINGRICGIPTETIFDAKSTAMNLPKSDWEQGPNDPQELFDWIVERNAEDGSVLVVTNGSYNSEPPFYLHPSYAQWPFDVDRMGIFYFDGEGNVSSYIESEIYEQDSEWMYEFQSAGVFVPQEMNTGSRHIGMLGGAFSESVWAERENYDYFSFDTGKRPLANGDRMYNVVPAGKDPEPMLRFFDWLYSDPENYRLLTYGIEGIHYELDEDSIPVSILDEKSLPLYWQGASFDCQLSMLFPTGAALDTLLEHYGITEDELLYSGDVMPFTGFTFDPEPVQEEYDALLAAMKGGLYEKIRDGFESLSLLDEAIDEMKRANLDIIIAECEEQYEAFKAMMAE